MGVCVCECVGVCVCVCGGRGRKEIRLWDRDGLKIKTVASVAASPAQ